MHPFHIQQFITAVVAIPGAVRHRNAIGLNHKSSHDQQGYFKLQLKAF